MPIRSVHCAPHLDNGGIGEAVRKLGAALAARGNEVRIHALEPASDAPRGVDLFAYRSGGMLKSFGCSKAMKHAIQLEAAGRADILHAHGLWRMSSVYPERAVRGKKCRWVISPHGTLAQWCLAHHKWRKKVFWALLQQKAVRRAHCLMVSSENELAEVRRLGLKNPAAIVPGAIEMREHAPLRRKSGVLRRLLFVGRLHPVKAIDRLLLAWQRIQARNPDWELAIAGSDEGGYRVRMQQLAAELKLERVDFPGPVRASERDALYQSADLFVLPSHTENFGIVVGEALANGVPAVVSRCAPWQGLEREGCGWWVLNEPEKLADALSAACAMPRERLAEMGLHGRAWVAREFSGARVAEMTEKTYLWLLGGGNAPEWVV